jgi:hypothetical protein
MTGARLGTERNRADRRGPAVDREAGQRRRGCLRSSTTCRTTSAWPSPHAWSTSASTETSPKSCTPGRPGRVSRSLASRRVRLKERFRRDIAEVWTSSSVTTVDRPKRACARCERRRPLPSRSSSPHALAWERASRPKPAMLAVNLVLRAMRVEQDLARSDSRRCRSLGWVSGFRNVPPRRRPLGGERAFGSLLR